MGGVGFDGLKIGGNEFHFDVFVDDLVEETGEAVERGIQIDRARLQVLTAREGQEFASERSGVVRGMFEQQNAERRSEQRRFELFGRSGFHERDPSEWDDANERKEQSKQNPRMEWQRKAKTHSERTARELGRRADFQDRSGK